MIKIKNTVNNSLYGQGDNKIFQAQIQKRRKSRRNNNRQNRIESAYRNGGVLYIFLYNAEFFSARDTLRTHYRRSIRRNISRGKQEL